MANADIPSGLSVARDQASGVHTGAAGRYYIPASDTQAAYLGSVVKLTGSGDADGIEAVTANVSTGDPILGVVVGVDTTNRDDTIHRQASQEMYVFVADDPNLVFEVQEDSVGAALAVTDIGSEKILLGLTSGNSTSGYSSTEIDSSSSPASGAGDVTLLNVVQREDNMVGTNAKWRVRLNNHARRGNAIAGV